MYTILIHVECNYEIAFEFHICWRALSVATELNVLNQHRSANGTVILSLSTHTIYIIGRYIVCTHTNAIPVSPKSDERGVFMKIEISWATKFRRTSFDAHVKSTFCRAPIQIPIYYVLRRDTHTWSTSEQTSHNTNSEHTPNYCFADISIENVYTMCMQLIRCVTSISKLEAHGLHLIDIISSSSPTHTQIRFTGQRMPIQLISSSALATHIWPQRHEYIALYTPKSKVATLKLLPIAFEFSLSLSAQFENSKQNCHQYFSPNRESSRPASSRASARFRSFERKIYV